MQLPLMTSKLNDSFHNTFATGSATGTTIAHEALSTKMSNGAIEFSYFVFESLPGIASPQVQEHHINTDAVRAHHILDDHVRSNHLSIIA